MTWRGSILFGLLALYALGLALLPPPISFVSDEAQYIRQALAYANGHTRIPVRDPLSGRVSDELPSTYPPGTSLLQAPLVRAGGWSAACWASFIGLAVLTFVTSLWLRGRKLAVSYAALLPLFVPASVLGRTGMGDLPSAAVVVTSLYVLDRSTRRRDAIAGGFLGGASLLFRDSNPLFVAPWMTGRLVRREAGTAMVCAAIVGVALRLALAWALQRDPLVLRPVYPFTLDGAGGRALLYGFALTVLVPGGLAALALYQGERRTELKVTVLLGLLFFVLYSYSGQYSGLLGSLILGPRYLIPVVPLLAIAVATAVEQRFSSARLKRLVELSVLLAAAFVTCAVHPLVHRWAERQAALVRALYSSTSPDAVLVTEPGATAKYLNGVYGARTLADKLAVPPEKLSSLLMRGPVQLVFIDRSDSEYWRDMTDLNQQYLDEVSRICDLHPRIDVKSRDHLRIFDVLSCH